MDSWEQTVEVPVSIRIPVKGDQPIQGEEGPHVDLANLNDDLESVRKFALRWGGERVRTKAQAKRYLEARDHLRAMWRRRDKPNNDVWNLARFLTDLEVVKHGVAFVISNLWVAIPMLFLKDQERNRTAICINRKCPRPYFIRRRKTQKYCEAGPCLARAQREQKREWWKRNRGKRAKQ